METLVNIIKNRVINTFCPVCAHLLICHGLYVLTAGRVTAFMVKLLLFPLFRPLLPDFLWEIRRGRCSYTYSLQQQAQHPRTVNHPGTGKLRTNWHFPPPTTSLIPSLSNSPGSALLFLPTRSSEGLCKVLSSLPGVSRQPGSSMLTSTTTKSTVLIPQAFPFHYGIPHHALPISPYALLE